MKLHLMLRFGMVLIYIIAVLTISLTLITICAFTSSDAYQAILQWLIDVSNPL